MTTPAPFRPGSSTSIRALAAALGGRVVGDGDVCVADVFQDSRRVQKGALFVVRSGVKTDGALFVKDALDRGAAALIVERDRTSALRCPPSVPVIEVSDVRSAIGRAASIVYGDPCSKLSVTGITGTNGKTTTAWLSATAIEGAGGRAGVVGTVGHRFENWYLDAANTTPEADDLMRISSEMLARGATHLVMEVASHALSQARADAMQFRVAAFSNLTQDHLDYHGDMASYGRAKERLFLELAPRKAVINVDTAFGADLASKTPAPVLRVSSRPGTRAEIVPAESSLSASGIRARVRTPYGEVTIDSRLIGAHNLDNLLLALGIAAALELDVTLAAQALSNAGVVPGRLERCDGTADDVIALVDYAHTPDALDHALSVLKPLSIERGGRLLCVFGCGGDRDPTKRAPMGAVVGRWADVAVVTSDNPRSEDPRAIIAQIVPGLANASAHVIVEPNRASAIQAAVTSARPGDVLLVAGKGHETYQIIGGTTRHFDDREQVRRALAHRRGEEERS